MTTTVNTRPVSFLFTPLGLAPSTRRAQPSGIFSNLQRTEVQMQTERRIDAHSPQGRKQWDNRLFELEHAIHYCSCTKFGSAQKVFRATLAGSGKGKGVSDTPKWRASSGSGSGSGGAGASVGDNGRGGRVWVRVRVRVRGSLIPPSGGPVRVRVRCREWWAPVWGTRV